MPEQRRVSRSPFEAAAAVADLGTLVPITASLVLLNGLDARAALFFAGLLFVAAGFVYGIPMAVQPIKAAAAIAIATQASPEVISAAGIGLGAVLVLLAATRLTPWVARLFPKPIIRGNQAGVGLLLIFAAYGLVSPREDILGFIVAVAISAGVAAAGSMRGLAALGVGVAGMTWSWLHGGGAVSLTPSPGLPAFDAPSAAALWTSMTLLVIPQIPLTLGNAVVGTADLAREYFGPRAARATPTMLSLTCGSANLVLGLFGGMPLCHGSSGLTAYHRFGARTGVVGIVLGSLLIVAALFFAPSAVAAFALIPSPVLAGLLAYTGAHHAMLARDQRGAMLVVVIAMAAVGAVTQNLMWGLVVGLSLYATASVLFRRKRLVDQDGVREAF
ncbi:MAG TPA: putative sulfate/molybdate transporter [Actinomycetota bacterium]|nr:putative sulfate/molybdate transporter [Actinomycetota bacterium]